MGNLSMGILQARIWEWVAMSFSRGIFPTKGSNPCLLHWQSNSLTLSHQGRPQNSTNLGKSFNLLRLHFPIHLLIHSTDIYYIQVTQVRCLLQHKQEHGGWAVSEVLRARCGEHRPQWGPQGMDYSLLIRVITLAPGKVPSTSKHSAQERMRNSAV